MIAPEAISLILEFEGLDQPGRWPGGASGITIGHGYDLGYTLSNEFDQDWTPFLTPSEKARLRAVIGRKGSAAESVASSLEDIIIKPAAATAVFGTATLPKFEAVTLKTFPGVELLPAKVLGALVSLVYNRGASLVGPRRAEMQRIHDALSQWSELAPFARRAGQKPLLLSIAAQIRSMKRLWVGEGLDGLLRRRDAEAKLVESAVTDPLPETA